MKKGEIYLSILKKQIRPVINNNVQLHEKETKEKISPYEKANQTINKK